MHRNKGEISYQRTKILYGTGVFLTTHRNKGEISELKD